MSKKNLQNIALVIILVAILALSAYYFLPKNQSGNVNQSSNYPEDFKVLSKDLTQQQVDEYFNRFNLLKQSLLDNPDQIDGWLELGMVKKYLGDYQGAEEAWVKAGELRPKNSTSFGNLADLYVNFTKEYDKAEVAYQKAIENSMGEAKNTMFYRNFYYFYKDYLKDDKKAENILTEAIKNNPQNTEMLVLMASFYKEKGNKSLARQYYQKALALDPTDDLIKQEIDKLR